MIIIFLAVLIAAIALAMMVREFFGDEYLSFWEKVGSVALYSLALGLMIVMATLITLITLSQVLYDPSYKVKKTTVTEIALMSDNIGTEGSWSLFGGSVNSSGKFFYYSDDNGVHRLESAEASDAEIIEDSADPYVEEIQYESVMRMWGAERAVNTKYVFHIPEGSINHTIDLDGE